MVNHKTFKEKSIHGRYVTSEMLKMEWLGKSETSTIKTIGSSVQENGIISISLGTGKNKILMWSQMHGNESTTTKAVVDLVNYLRSGETIATSILENCSLLIIPILNPDGAKQYTRVNANKIDLNRDAKQLTQPESKILRNVFEEFRPDYCFNLHDQRTLFSAGKDAKPATVSFLAPASDQDRQVTPTREKAMKLIVAMNKMLQQLIPGQVGRYDDGFNDNCVGDTFQMLKVPTILFEAGHFPKDYEREKTREYIFYALIESINTIAASKVEEFKSVDYLEIPENQKLFYDVIVRHVGLVNSFFEPNENIGIRFKEVLRDNKLLFEPELIDSGKLEGYFGHEILDCSSEKAIEDLYSRKEILNLILSKKK
ncbi:M14 family metallopeptidase [Flagellimonas eckloniae]|uniref:Peptidase M14 n=1 Tax=Flagellimonas eckloniae TaxID=346185 RepID=A0A0Q0WUR5_9FLAO|nr:M14 metallopeptidase family protein [Allomuricauda eckloniae]KQC29183.1 peptidase M14 [Allomuricauda eckloniae]